MSGEDKAPAVGGEGLISSGIPGLDFQLGGGIPTGSLVLLYGSPLSGLGEFSRQFWKTDAMGESSYFMLDSSPAEGMIDAKDLSPEEIAGCIEGKSVVIDSLSTLLTKFGPGRTAGLLRDCSEKIRAAGGIVLLTMYDGVASPYEEALVMRNCDAVFLLGRKVSAGGVEMNLQVAKIRGIDLPPKIYPYRILRQGIELSTTGRVF